MLVPLITGMSPSVALFTAGIGTLLFHLCTKGIVPVFLGSSFAFIPALCAVIGKDGIPAAQFGIIAAGAVYLVFSILAKVLGADALRKLFPPVVTGPVIIIIGLSLTGVGISDAMGGKIEASMFALHNIIIALFTFAIVAIGMNSRFKLWRMIPILFGIFFGYILCVILHVAGLFTMDFSPIAKAPWINVPYNNGFFTLPAVNWQAVLFIAPIAIVTFMEHIGDITTNGAVVGKDFFKDPGLHRTLLGDGLATMVAGFFGGPCNTTYSENTGVLASTGNYNPALLRLAAVFALFLGLLGKFGAVLQTIPHGRKDGSAEGLWLWQRACARAKPLLHKGIQPKILLDFDTVHAGGEAFSEPTLDGEVPPTGPFDAGEAVGMLKIQHGFDSFAYVHGKTLPEKD